ncbi:hypothetical protein ACJIZ3_016386 [Penstemon smallii]|uniref:Uncharacterized protein n=1 Tax=Penstemon smallii TaxID=265156 RepID=A0ABD3RQG9_9LAMI
MGSKEEKTEEEWKVGPTEDVVQALMESLVDPRLPPCISATNPPSIDDQKAIARQMHAVVLLYNYYHRKQKPELEFLDFTLFCKLAVSLRPPLLYFMALTNESISKEANGSKDQLSVTEKAIKNACDIALTLDASIDYPNTEGWPMHKVAVLLIDSKKENCMIQFGDITEGVWSLFEKDVRMLEEETVGNKRKISSLKASADVNESLKVVCHVVKDAEGFDIDTSNLVILETHVVYSLSKEKSAAQFYMVQSPQTFKESEQVRLKFLVESLRGPLAEKAFGSWSITPVVEYYHMLPYVEFISRWFLRKDLCLSNQVTTMNNGMKDFTQSKMSTLPVSKCNGENLDHTEDDTVPEKLNKRRNTTVSTKKDANIMKTPDTKGDDEKTVIGENAAEGTNKKPNSKLREYLQRRNSMSSTQHDTLGPNKNLNVEMVDSLKSKDTTQCKYEKVSFANNDDATILCDQNSISRKENQVSQFEAITKYTVEVENVPEQEVWQTTLAIVQTKRRELWSQMCSMEDTLALYENIVDKIRGGGGDVGFAHKCTQSILSGKINHLMPKHEDSIIQDKGHGEDHSKSQCEQQIRLYGTFFPWKSSCQGLGCICLNNGWRLPRYFIEPSNGKFLSTVFVSSIDFNLTLTSKSGLESNPSEARESAAAQMIAKIKNA